MSTDGHGIKVTSGRPRVRWTVLRPAPSPCPSVLKPALKGFSVIEFVGVLSIIAIMASALAPVVVKRLDYAAWQKEQTDLQTIMTNLAQGIVQTKTLPSTTTWAYLASSNLSVSPASITTSSRGVARLYLIDNSGWLGNNGLTYPCTQTETGFSQPTQARVLLVSSIDSKNGVPPLVQADFPATWNWDTALSTIKPTTGAWGAWLGKGSDVIIRRLEMKSLFHRVVLVNRDVILNGGSGQTAYYRMNGLPVVSPASLGTANPIIDSYYIDGSVLSLYTNGASGPGLSVSEVVKKDESRIFESNAWRDSISAGPPIANNLTSLADAFLSSASPPAGNKRGDNTYGVGDMLLSYMSAYSSWANMSPCFTFEGQGNNKFVPEYVLLNNVITCFGNPGNGSCQIMP